HLGVGFARGVSSQQLAYLSAIHSGVGILGAAGVNTDLEDAGGVLLACRRGDDTLRDLWRALNHLVRVEDARADLETDQQQDEQREYGRLEYQEGEISAVVDQEFDVAPEEQSELREGIPPPPRFRRTRLGLLSDSQSPSICESGCLRSEWLRDI